MAADTEVQRAALNRLKRARGQLDAVIRMVEEGAACEPTVTQLAAVSKALDRAGFMMISTGLRDCLAGDEDDREDSLARLEKVFLSLA
ncbi:metal-sensitive transcriptional regulator [Demequina sp. NBRC 110057]|uniref:metal-sensitive transcriptional regulator n=1 Tax=Demequina sp. NBRC 110057 TaxID=1570346 RepID=UPI0009FBE0B2|nr:metal-sensitive transcriptional regulator [Demequina sp. NBRC 110057]